MIRSPIDRALVWFDSKGAWNTLSPLVRETYKATFIPLIRDPSTAPPDERAYFQRIHNRLLKFETQDVEIHKPESPRNVQKFDPKLFPKYDHTNTVFLKWKGIEVQRAQNSGLCYMHAPALVQYYAIAQATNGKTEHKMLDIFKMIRDSYSPQKLYDHVMKDEGGNSREFLNHILHPNSIIVAKGFDASAITAINQYGAGLISCFKVHEDFLDDKQFQEGKPSGKFHGLHAMALVGAREDKEKK